MGEKYTAGLLDIGQKVCYNVLNAGRTARGNLTDERVKTMNAMMNNAVPTAVSASLYVFAYQYYCFFLQQEEESCFVLRTGHTGVCSDALTGRA
jgi:hypothetical protein